MEAKILLVGVATDGPHNEAMLPQSERQLVQMLGGNYVQRCTVSATATAQNLTYEPYLMPTNTVNGIKQYLYSPSVSGQQLSFGSVGGTGASVDLQYSPYLGQSDLLWAARKMLAETGEMPAIARVGGTYASLSVGNWKFISRFPGLKYNSLTLSYTGGVFTISGLEPNFPTLTYGSTYSINEIKQLLDRDFDLGLSPVAVQDWTPTLPTFSTQLTGGTDGSMSTASIESFLQDGHVPSEIAYIVFLAPVTSSFIQLMADLYQSQSVQPRMLFFAAPDYFAPTYDWLYDCQVRLPVRHGLMCAFVGTTRMRLFGREVQRYAVEAATIGLSKQMSANLTNVSVPAVDFSPVLSETDLDLCKSAGFIPLMRYIGNDISVYEGTNSSGGPPYLYSAKIAEIMAVANAYCQQFLGSAMQNGAQPGIRQELITRLGRLTRVTIDDVTVIVAGDTMYVTIDAYIANEILSLSFTIKNF
jgi:hypothetical protein